MSSTNNKGSGIVTALLFGGIGIIFIIVGMIIISKPIKEFNTYEKTNAIVTNIEKHTRKNSDGEDETYYDIYVDYETKTGEVKGVRLPESDSTTKVGQKRKIYYNPAHPEKPLTIGSMFVAPGIFIFLGTISLLVVVALLLDTKNVNNKKNSKKGSNKRKKK